MGLPVFYRDPRRFCERRHQTKHYLNENPASGAERGGGNFTVTVPDAWCGSALSQAIHDIPTEQMIAATSKIVRLLCISIE
jgi:hypothetical protein